MFFRKNNPQKSSGSPIDFMIVGLGNPGSKYENTRHNAGFAAIDFLAKELGASVTRMKFKSLVGEAKIGGHRVLLMKPSTFMNLSGQAVTEAMHFYKLEPTQVLILFDDISLEPGRLRIRKNGSAGGHNGMKNIIYLSGREDFPRIKLGVGKKPHPDYDLADWVLSRFTEPDHKLLLEAVENAAKAALLIVENNTEKAMNLYNS